MANPEIVAKVLVELRLLKLGLDEADLTLIKQLCLPHKIICTNMGISHTALRTRVKRLMVKMGVENQRALIVKAVRLDLVSIDSFDYREFNGKNLS